MIAKLLEYPYLFAGLAFVLGAIIGSFLNVCILRMPLQKSIFWPGSRCNHCLKPIRFLDNIPLFSYLWRRGKCRSCGAKFSARYFWIELLTGMVFAGLFWLEVQWNLFGISVNPLSPPTPLAPSMQSKLLVIWAYHCILFSLLIVAFFTDVDHQEIPMGITLPGAILGVIGGTLFPWPWPNDYVPASAVFENVRYGGWLLPIEAIHPLQQGLQRWPVWMPLPEWLPPGSWQLGLVTALAGMAAGWISIWLIRVIFTWALGKEAMGLGDADLMMMIGAFLGWQSLIGVFILALPFALLYAVLQILRDKGPELPFGPFLAIGAVLTTLAPWWLGRSFQQFFFDGLNIVRILLLFCVLGLFVILTLRMFRLVGQTAAGTSR
jgi:leader peptidase (prepilin peptidase)/N-methyltransferase